MAVSSYKDLSTGILRPKGLALSNSFLPESNKRLAVLLGGLCLAAYAPALNNGFISDDYVMLEWVRMWKQDFSYLLRIVPDVFRITTYALLWILEQVFGYRPEYFYGFAISVHFLNSILLWKFLSLLTGSRQVATLAAIIFAVFQNPQEAIMWLAAMGDALAGLCVLGSLLFWLRKRFMESSLCYMLGLFSKESVIVLLFLLPLIEASRTKEVRFRREYLYLLIPTLIFLAVFIYSASANYMLTKGVYAFGPKALWVLVLSLHRLMFPWLYVGVLAFVISQGRYVPRELGAGLLWMTLSLLPFIFLTYQNHVPSRHQYLASMGLAWCLAALLANIDLAWLRHGFIIGFISINIGYIWLVKDAQFERRAAPTTELLKELRARSPGPLLVLNFPINEWMAKMTAPLVPGWRPQMIRVDEPPEACPDCLKLRWNRTTEKFDSLSGREQSVTPSETASR